jgi:hypothetical protein
VHEVQPGHLLAADLWIEADHLGVCDCSMKARPWPTVGKQS